jgi:hypothetical protein
MNLTRLKLAKEWFRSLSSNEQRLYAKEFLEEYKYNMLLGNTSQYTSYNKWNELHLELYDKYNSSKLK